MKRIWKNLVALIDDVKKLMEEQKSNSEICAALDLKPYQLF